MVSSLKVKRKLRHPYIFGPMLHQVRYMVDHLDGVFWPVSWTNPKIQSIQIGAFKNVQKSRNNWQDSYVLEVNEIFSRHNQSLQTNNSHKGI